MQAMILAAGFGTRLRPITDHIPKPLFPVLGIPNLKRILDNLAETGFERVAVNAHHLSDLLKKAIAQWSPRINVALVEEPEILGTGGGVRNALPFFDEGNPILLINGDVVSDLDLPGLVRIHEGSGADATMALHRRAPWNRVAVSGGNVTGFGNDGPDALAYTGIAVLEPRFVASIPPGSSSLIDAFVRTIRSGGRITARRIDGDGDRRPCTWEDMGSPQGYIAAHEALLLRTGKGLYADPSADIPQDLQWEGWAMVGAGVSIGRGVTLNRSVIWNGCSIPAGERLDHTVVTPFGRLTAGR